MRIAIIGTRNPTEPQIHRIKSIIDTISIKYPNSQIISGCAVGIDSIALTYAFNKNLYTIGCIPWKGFNPLVQEFCKEIINLSTVSDALRIAAMESITKYHPNPKAVNRTASLLHARNYLIINAANLVIAAPKDMGGGTMQGVRIAKGLDMSNVLIDNDGETNTWTK